MAATRISTKHSQATFCFLPVLRRKFVLPQKVQIVAELDTLLWHLGQGPTTCAACIKRAIQRNKKGVISGQP